MALTIDSGVELLKKAYESRTEDLLMQRWMLHYEGEISFNDFKKELMVHRTATNKTEEEILTDVKDIIDTFNEKVR